MFVARLLLLSAATSLLVGAGHVTELSVPEEGPTGTLVGSVAGNPDIGDLTATDANALRFNFRFSSGPYELFSIDDRSGEIRTGRRVDREQLCPPNLQTPSSSSSCVLELDITVLPLKYYRILKAAVTVVDVNDHSPEFPDPTLVLDIRESSPAGTRVPIQTAEDVDSGDYGVQRYELSESAGGVFGLSVSARSDGELDVWLTVERRLDREERSSYSLTIVAFDGGTPPLSGSVDVRVVVGDSNDNSPRFDDSTYDVEVSELSPPGTTIVRVHAIDPDDGQNGVVVYRLGSRSGHRGSPFAVHNRTGEVTLAASLDFEAQTSHQLTVVAEDLGVGSLPAYARVNIRVLDENDNAPEILVNPLTDSGRVEAPENTQVGAFAAYVAVRDADSGKNGAAECRIGPAGSGRTSGHTPFRLEAVSSSEYKLLTTSVFDREDVSHYSLALTCKDLGTPSLSSSTAIQVFIVDENDHSPVFRAPTGSGTMLVVEHEEGNRVGAVVARVTATDEDEGANARLTYSMLPTDGTPEGVLEVVSDTGDVVATTKLDYETRREYRYEVTVQDGGTPSRSSTQSLVIQVVDVNDELPTFDRSVYYFHVTENRPSGTVVGSVRATDADSSPAFSRITYSIAQGGRGSFNIDSSTGRITLSRRLDRERTPSFDFTVTAVNDGFPGSTGSVAVTVTVDDENDHDPVVRSPTAADQLVVQLSRQTSPGTLVTRVEATDPDEGQNAELSYWIANGNEDGFFAVDRRTGAVTVARRLDPVFGRSFRLVVTVKDGGNPERLAVADIAVVVNGTGAVGSAAVARRGVMDAARITVVAAVVSGSIVVVSIVIVVLVIFTCRCRRRKSSRRRQEWLRQQAVNGSVPGVRRDAAVGAPGRAECSPVPSVVERRSLRTWSAVDKATETEQEDTENEDVPMSGLLQCSRRDADDAQQSIALMSTVACGPSSAGGSLSQRTTPDVLRPAGCGPGSDAVAPIPHGAVCGGGGGSSRGPPRHRRQHGGHSRRRQRSPAYHRPCSAASAGQRLAVPSRRPARHHSKSDFEVGNDSDSEFSGSTTCRDSGMDPSEDSDHVPYVRNVT